MKHYFAYIRVSTAKQGVQGSSLQEQHDAIVAFAKRSDFVIAEWFEDRETAAKRGRTQFLRMMNGLEKKRAAGVILHKIDRGARNLWDWARIQDLIDAGTEVHFAHDNLDLTSRGGRLSADIQAVVAADFIRNLRDEVRKGMRGRLKQGLYPMRAPIGYLDQGKAKPKTIDPLKGPLVRQAFELYGTGQYTFETLRIELKQRGLHRQDGESLSLNGLTTMLRNPFYVGIIRLRRSGETFPGVHEALIDVRRFQRVQDVLDGKMNAKVTRHDFLCRRLLRCGICNGSLTGELQKGNVYYRCHTKKCETKTVREEAVVSALTAVLAPMQFSAEHIEQMLPLAEEINRTSAANREVAIRAATLRMSGVEDRERRLTDAYIDRLIDRETYNGRKATLLLDLARAREEVARLNADRGEISARLSALFELPGKLQQSQIEGRKPEFRELVRSVTSNCTLTGNELGIAMRSPYREMLSELSIPSGEPFHDSFRTESHRTFDILIKHIKDWEPPRILKTLREQHEEDVRVYPWRGKRRKHFPPSDSLAA